MLSSPKARIQLAKGGHFAGAGTHPAAGLPGAMSSGETVADLIGRAAPEMAPGCENRLAIAEG